MATTWTSTDLARIEKAIASGVLEVHFEDRTVRYQSLKDLLAARAAIEDELLANSPKPPRQVRFGTKSGFGC